MSAWGGRGRGGNNGVAATRGNGRAWPQNNGNGNNNNSVAEAPTAGPSASASVPVQPLGAGANGGGPTAPGPSSRSTENPWNNNKRPASGNGNGNGNNNAAPAAAAAGANAITAGIQRVQIRGYCPPSYRDPVAESPISAAAHGHASVQRSEVQQEEGRRARRPRPTIAERMDYVDTRKNISNSTKVGSKGNPVNLVANYFRLKRRPDWCMFHYHVDFKPAQTNTRLKRELVRQQSDRLRGFVTDGSSIWTVQRLTVTATGAQPLILFSTTPRGGEQVELEISFVREVDDGDPCRLQIFNVIMRTCFGPTADGGLGLVLNRRNYFDPTQGVNIEDKRLTIWPGYVATLRQFEDGLMLNVGIKHKIIRKDTCLDVIRGQRNDEAVLKELVGSIVMTLYNNKTYKIADIDFGKTPMSTFSFRNGNTTTYMDYYQKRHEVVIRVAKQPLLMAQLKKKDFHRGAGAAGGDDELETIYLVPELCNLTGLKENERSNYQFMRPLNDIMMQSPAQKMIAIRSLVGRFQSHAGVNGTLNLWGLDFEPQPVQLGGRELPSQVVLMKPRRVGNDTSEQLRYQGSDWSNAARDHRMEDCKPLIRWIIIRPASLHPAQSPARLLTFLKDVCRGLGFQINDPLEIVSVGDGRTSRPGDFQKEIQSKCGQYRGEDRLNLIVAILPNENKDFIYNAVKKECCLAGVHSQCVAGRTVGSDDSKFRSVATKIVIQINAKLGGIPWKTEAPFKIPTMVIGFDVYHCGKATGRSVGAMVATFNPSLSKFYSTATWQERGQEISTSMCINIAKCINAFTTENRNKSTGASVFPQSVIFFRDGVGEGQLTYVVNVELAAIKDALKSLYASQGKPEPKLTFIVVTKRINARVFKPDRASTYVDTVPGTVVDTVITQPERYDFFLTSVKAPRNGMVSPTGYNVIRDDMNFEPDVIQEFTYRLCHGYYNWSGTVSVPSVCQYAHKLAFLTGMANLGPDNIEALSHTLYYL